MKYIITVNFPGQLITFANDRKGSNFRKNGKRNCIMKGNKVVDEFTNLNRLVNIRLMFITNKLKKCNTLFK